MSSDSSLVSCIMPTFNRRAFVPLAIRYFLRQDYPNKELIVIDDGTDAVADLMPPDERVRYVRLNERRTVGAKRNLACEQARGEIIVHWDDDDWSAPRRVSYQVDQMSRAGADIGGLDRLLFYAPLENRAWEYTFPASQRRWVYGASLSYVKDFWKRHPFPDIGVGEDTRFVWADPRAKIHVLPDTQILVALLHSGNTSRKRTSDPRYQAKRVEDTEQLLANDVSCYYALRNGAKGEQSRSGEGSAGCVRMDLGGNGSNTVALGGAADLASDRRRGTPDIRSSPGAAASHSSRPSALITAGPGIGDILRITPFIRVAHQLGYDVDLLLVADYPEVVELLKGAPEIRSVFHVPGRYCTNGSTSLDGLLNRFYDVASFTPWSAILHPRVRSRRVLEVDRGKWLGEGYSQSVEQLASDLGWQGVMPEPFACASQRDFQLAPGTVAIHPGCNLVAPWKRWHGFDELARLFPHVAIVGGAEDLRTDKTYFSRPFTWPEHALNFVGKLNLADTAALLRQCAAVLSNDSGMMHLGVALGVPTFGIFGITSPHREAMPAKHFFPITKGLPCEAACHRGRWGRSDCEHHLRCLKTLTPKEVMQHILKRVPDIATRTVELDSRTTSPVARKSAEPIRVSAEITGGIGDLVVASCLLKELHNSVPEFMIEVFYHTPELARFVFHQARYVRTVQATAGFAEAHRHCDLALRIHSLVRFEIRDREKLRRVDPHFLEHLDEAMRRFESFRGFFEKEPQFDGLWGRVCVRHGHDRRTNFGWLSGLRMDQNSPLFLAPDPGEYAFFERCFPDPSTPYVTIHDGFDNKMQLPPGAATKCWPLRHWTTLVQELKRVKPGVKIVQLGGLNSRSIPGVDLDLVRRTSLPQAAWIIKHAQVHIDGDSGLVHLARSLHTPCVVLFGPTDDQFFGYKENLNLAASGCSNCWWSTPTWLSRCPRGLLEPECMTAILPESVRGAACKVIERRQNDACEVVASAVYGAPSFCELDDVLDGIFHAASIPRVPISRHGQSHESFLYLHASKQWEYLFAWRHLAERYSGKIAGVRIADLGGGRGALSAFLASRGTSIDVFDVDYLWDHGGDLDIERRFLRWAQEHGYRPRFGSLFNLPINDATYDVVTSISVVEHLRYKRYALKEALRILKPGGLLLLTFDLSLTPERHQDALRHEIFSPQSLDAALADLGSIPAQIRPDTVAESAHRIQRDQVLGIPIGMTVGGVAIIKR